MDHAFAHIEAQTYLKQRNYLAVTVAILAILSVVLFVAGLSRDREVVLQPIFRSPVTISTAGVSREYMEFVTRDTTHLILNRSPENLQYWMDSILAITAPRSQGALKRDLMKIMSEQQGSSISQYFTISQLTVDPKRLVSEVNGTLHTVVGSREVTSEQKRFRFVWEYSGLSLRLRGFGMLSNQANPDGSRSLASEVEETNNVTPNE